MITQRASLLPELEGIFVKYDLGISAERCTSELTGDDAGTIVEICITLLVLSAGVVTYVVCSGLLLLLASVSAHLLHGSPL